MFLLKNIIRRGISLEDIKGLDINENLKSKILQEFEREKKIADEKEDIYLKEVFRLLKSQSRIDGEIYKIIKEYNINNGKFKEGYCDFLHINQNENDYIFTFLCNRAKKLTSLEFVDYNDYFLREKNGKVAKKLDKYIVKERNISFEEMIDNAIDSIKKPSKIKEISEKNEIIKTPEINKDNKNGQETDKRRKRRDNCLEEKEIDPEIAEIIARIESIKREDIEK